MTVLHIKGVSKLPIKSNPELPGLHPRGGALVRVPTKEEMTKFWQSMKAKL